jgi:hypothetical protein
MESKPNILPVESDHTDAARYAIERKRMEQVTLPPKNVLLS